ncbi:MAG: pyrroline-5-carboxylate reductase [Candidatus Protistobacter heckmanni]|nr:pyrroline-5-carboxylate reductase [Candidatus Protistobacter heckmanni]
MLDSLSFGFIGGGNMAQALLGSLLSRGAQPGKVAVVEPYETTRTLLRERYGVDTAAAPGDFLRECDVLILAVKPQQFRSMAEQIAPWVGAQLLMSVAAGIRLQDMQRWFGGHGRIVRAMPNTPALIGAGMTGLAAAPGLADADKRMTEAVASAVGETVWVRDDAQIDVVTAISGSGPAYGFYLIEAMQEAAVALGLGKEQGRKLAIATIAGAASLAAQSPDSPAELRRKVTSPSGTTAAAIGTLEEARVKAVFLKAIEAAAKRGAQMGEEFGKQ